MAALESNNSAAYLINLADCTSPYAEITFAYAALYSFAAIDSVFYKSAFNYISFINIFSISIPHSHTCSSTKCSICYCTSALFSSRSYNVCDPAILFIVAKVN